MIRQNIVFLSQEVGCGTQTPRFFCSFVGIFKRSGRVGGNGRHLSVEPDFSAMPVMRSSQQPINATAVLSPPSVRLPLLQPKPLQVKSAESLAESTDTTTLPETDLEPFDLGLPSDGSSVKECFREMVTNDGTDSSITIYFLASDQTTTMKDAIDQRKEMLLLFCDLWTSPC